jgi:8-oxo-dGTP diphosphatase
LGALHQVLKNLINKNYNNMTGILLYILAFFLVRILYFFGNIVSTLILIQKGIKEVDLHYFTMAVANDQYGNVFLAPIMNRWFITKNGYKFGNPDETISFVIAINFALGELRPRGLDLYILLEKIDKGHAVKSIEKELLRAKERIKLIENL